MLLLVKQSNAYLILPVNKKNDPFICDEFVAISVPLLNMSISWENAVNETQQFTADPIVNSKIKAVVTWLPKSISNLFLDFLTDHNKEIVVNFLALNDDNKGALARTEHAT